MKSSILLFALTLVSALPAFALLTVYPTGAYPADVAKVQAAVAQGGTVLLKATNAAGRPTAFNFGPPAPGSGSVTFTRDITIRGERASGNNRTTIRGGSSVFISAAPVHSSVREIVFVGPQFAAFVISATSGAEFSCNRVTNIAGQAIFPDSPDVFISQAVRVQGQGLSMSGGVALEDNVIENSLGNRGFGLVANLEVTTWVRIARNVIRGMSSGGILVGFNTRDAVIEDNVVAPGPGSAADADFAIPFGIQAGPSTGGTYVIRHNRVRCENPQADGIVLFGTEDSTLAPLVPITGAVVAQNDVHMHDSLFGGISLYGSVTRSRIAGNRISGDGAFALNASTSGVLDTDLVDSNIFHRNDLSRFLATDADVFFDVNTLDNVFFGPTGTLVDLGTGNRFK